MLVQRSAKIALAALAFLWGTSSWAFDAAKLQKFWQFYNARHFAAAADIFDGLVRGTPPDVNAFYYAALANKEAHRVKRANELFHYVVTYFPDSAQAAFAKRNLQGQPAVPAGGTQLEELIRASLPPEMRARLDTEAGRQVLEKVMKDKAKEADTVKQAVEGGIINKGDLAQEGRRAIEKETIAARKPDRKQPFTAEDIANDGPGAIDQSRYPNCWFESSMSALAALPRGQKLMADMIRWGEGDEYIVRFPGDGIEYTVTPQDLEDSKIKDKALWASIIECAQLQKFPHTGNQLAVGLGCLTGCKAQVLVPLEASKQEISSFIDGAIKGGNPVICATWDEDIIHKLRAPVIGQHAYTIIGFDASKSMITLRNPHGRHSEHFEVEDDPQHFDFEQLDDGVFKMSIPLFQKCFDSICRSFI